jgi:hypothetical protein
LARASTLFGFSVPPVIRHVTSALENSEGVTPYGRAYHNLARCTELLGKANHRRGKSVAHGK